MRIWRISDFADLSGKGGELSARRWNHMGTRIVYCAEHPALAMLEIIVNVDPEDLPTGYKLLEIEVPPQVSIEEAALPQDWQTNLQITRDIWQRFVAKNNACLLHVPSIVMPHAHNILINPQHQDHAKLTIKSAVKYPFDARFEN